MGSWLGDRLQQIRQHVTLPLHRNAYLLMLSSGITSGLGLVYWILAARLFTSQQVGIGSLLISTMMVLSNVSQLNLLGAMNRFLPRAGALTLRIISYGYAVSLLASFVGSVIFVAGIDLWSPTLAPLFADGSLVVWFVAATMAWCLFNLQDAVLVGMREATWVPIENTAFALGKIFLIWLLYELDFFMPIFASWTLPLAGIIVVVNLYIFLKVTPRSMARTRDNPEVITLRRLAGFTSGDYLGTLFAMAAVGLVPIIITNAAGPSANAHYYLAWTICYSLYMVGRNVGMSLITEGVISQDTLDELFRKAMAQAASIMVPAVALLLVGADLVLSIFGAEYAEQSTDVLRLLLLSTLPGVLNTLYLARAKVLRRIGEIILLQALLCGIVIGLALALLEPYGLVGIGAAWLTGQASLAVLISVTRLRGFWLSVVYAAPVGGLIRARRRALNAVSRLRRGRRLKRRWPEIQAALAAGGTESHLAAGQMRGVLAGDNEICLVILESNNGTARGVLKVPATEAASRSLAAHIDRLDSLHADDRLATQMTLVPRVLGHGIFDGRVIGLEQRMNGTPMTALLRDRGRAADIVTSAARAIGQLRRASQSARPVTDAELSRWVDGPAEAVGRALVAHDPDGQLRTDLTRCADGLRAALAGRTMAFSWHHGDFTPGNILFDTDAMTVTGIIDWETADDDGFAWLDVFHLLLAVRCMTGRRELGTVVTALLPEPTWTATEQQVLSDMWAEIPGERPDDRTAVLLAWLTHINANLAKSTAFASNRAWLARNVSVVLRSI